MALATRLSSIPGQRLGLMLAACFFVVGAHSALAQGPPPLPGPPPIGESGALGIPSTYAFDGFTAAGFAPAPAEGQLSSQIFALTGFSDGELPFGGTQTSGDFARGESEGGVTSGGLYAYSGEDGPWLFIQPTGADFNPGTLTMRYENTTGAAVGALEIGYEIKVFNDQPRSNTWNFSYSTDDVNYTAVPTLDYESPLAPDDQPSWITVPRSTTLTGLNLQPGDHFYIRFSSADVGGSGARDEIGINNVTVVLGDEPDDPALLQIVHAAPDAAFENVNVYASVDGGAEALLASLAFQQATAYTAVPAGSYTIRVTPAGDPSTTLIEESVEVSPEETLQVIAIGVDNPADHPANPEGLDTSARLLVLSPAATGAGPDDVQVGLVHGSPDFPTITPIDRPSGQPLGLPLAFGEFATHEAVVADTYLLDLVDGDEEALIGFRADLADLGGEAVTIIATGFSDLATGGGRHIGLLAVFPDGTTSRLPYAIDIATARQLPLGTTVEVTGTVTRAEGAFTYMQDETAGMTVRQTASGWQEDVAAGIISAGTTVEVTGRTSQFRGLFQINQVSAEVNDLISYTIFFQGQLPEPISVTLEDIAQDGETYEARLVEVVNLSTTASGLFTAATTYPLSDPTLEPGIVDLRVPNANDTEVVGMPIPDELFTFRGVVGQFTPTSTGPMDEGYQLLVITEMDIMGQAAELATVQVIHNAPDPALEDVDVYLNGELALPSLSFREATPFIQIPAAVTLTITLADSEEVVYTEDLDLLPETNYQLIAIGVGDGDFTPNPAGADIGFTLFQLEDARQAGIGGPEQVDVAFVHASPDVGHLTIHYFDSMPVIVFDEEYGGFSDYVSLPAQPYLFGATSDQLDESFQVDASGMGGQAVTVLTSGFANPDAQPAGAPEFGMLIVFADGNAEFYPPTDVSTEPSTLPASFAVESNYPNPFTTSTTLRFDLPVDAEVSVEVFDLLGRRVLVAEPGHVPAGAAHAVQIEAGGMAAGTYVWRLTARTAGQVLSESGRMTVVR